VDGLLTPKGARQNWLRSIPPGLLKEYNMARKAGRERKSGRAGWEFVDVSRFITMNSGLRHRNGKSSGVKTFPCRKIAGGIGGAYQQYEGKPIGISMLVAVDSKGQCLRTQRQLSDPSRAVIPKTGETTEFKPHSNSRYGWHHVICRINVWFSDFGPNK